MKIGIHGKSFSKAQQGFIQEMFDLLHSGGFQVFATESFYNILKKSSVKFGSPEVFEKGDDISNMEFMFSVGGDGTFLDTLTYIGPYETPILGVNIGRLGFLAHITQHNFREALQCLQDKKFDLESRTLIHVDSNKDLFKGVDFGLNEFAILKKDTSSMIVVHTYIDDIYLNSYYSDGLIISTPTGSTGYSLSCGGPLALPTSNNFIITPISAHNLNVRPMVVSDDSRISFRVEGRSRKFLATLDSRYSVVDQSVKISVRKENFKVRMLKPEGQTFFDTLRMKLHWGLDARN